MLWDEKKANLIFYVQDTDVQHNHMDSRGSYEAIDLLHIQEKPNNWEELDKVVKRITQQLSRLYL